MNQMKKKFEEPEVELMKFEVEDILSTSNTTDILSLGEDVASVD